MKNLFFLLVLSCYFFAYQTNSTLDNSSSPDFEINFTTAKNDKALDGRNIFHKRKYYIRLSLTMNLQKSCTNNLLTTGVNLCLANRSKCKSVRDSSFCKKV